MATRDADTLSPPRPCSPHLPLLEAQPLLHGTYCILPFKEGFTLLKAFILPYPTTPIGQQDPFSSKQTDTRLAPWHPCPLHGSVAQKSIPEAASASVFMDKIKWPHVPTAAQSQGKQCPMAMQVAHRTAPSSAPLIQGQHLPPLSSAVQEQKWKNLTKAARVTVPNSKLWVQQLRMPAGTGSSHCSFLGGDTSTLSTASTSGSCQQCSGYRFPSVISPHHS